MTDDERKEYRRGYMRGYMSGYRGPWRAKRKELGLCRDCDQPRVTKSFCEKHRVLHNAQTAARKARRKAVAAVEARR